MLLNLPYYFLFPLLFATGMLAGTVDAIAGGGGLISVPMLMGVGVPPHVALGTNKLQSIVGISISTIGYYRRGLISLIKVYKGLLCGFIGAASGSLLGQIIDSDILKKVIPILLTLILLYVILFPKLGMEDNKPKVKEIWFFTLFGFFLGFYDGFFGPGTGSFWIFALTFFLGYNLTKATAYTKILNLNSNLIATACFALGHNIDYRIAFFMATGQIIGSRLGVYLAIKKGARFIRILFILIVSLTIIGLMYK